MPGPIVTNETYDKEAVDSHGNKVTFTHKAASKRMRDTALMAAAHAYKRLMGEEGGVMYGIFHRDMAVSMIVKWSLPIPVSKEGWDQLTPEMGDAIVKELGLNQLMQGALEGNAVEKAKNSSAPSSEGAGSAT